MKRLLMVLMMLAVAVNCWALTGWGYKSTITIPSAQVAAELVEFPVLLTSTQTDFIGKCNSDGSDFRITLADGTTELPVHLISYNNTTGKLVLRFKATLSNTADNVYQLWMGNSSATLPAVDAANGSRAVYASRYLASYSTVDATGNIADSTANNKTGTTITAPWGESAVSGAEPNSAAQGVVFDGTNYFAIGTNWIRKRATFTGEAIATNLTPFASVDGTVNHLGAGDVDGDYLYLPVELFTAPSTFSNQFIVRYAKSNLAYVDKFDVSAQSAEISGLCIVPTHGTTGIVYVVSYLDGSKIWKYDLSDMSYIGAITLSATLGHPQGITWSPDDNAFYVSLNGAGTIVNQIAQVALNGTVSDKYISGKTSSGGVNEAESVQYYDGNLLWYIGVSNKIITMSKLTDIAAVNSYPILSGDKQFNFAAISQTLPDTGTITMLVRPNTFFNYNSIFDSASDANNWEGWLYDTGFFAARVNGATRPEYNLATATTWRAINFAWAKNGLNVDVKLFVDGTQRDTTKTETWYAPGATAYFGGGNAGNNKTSADYEHISITNSVLSDAWIAADSVQLLTNSTFVSTTAPVQVAATVRRALSRFNFGFNFGF